jgi:hypothetical protein
MGQPDQFIKHIWETETARATGARVVFARAPYERRTVASRLRSHGAEQLGGLILDLKPAQLAAWLADPEAK